MKVETEKKVKVVIEGGELISFIAALDWVLSKPGIAGSGYGPILKNVLDALRKA